MHEHTQLIEDFYSAFQKLDGEAMSACYHPDIRFSDPVFPDLQGEAAGAMWKMLCSGAKSFELTFSDVQADDKHGSAHWEARYTFSATGRPVHNVISANFRFRDGKIVQHDDHFDFWKWSRMALGAPGVLLGWSPMLRNKVRSQAAAKLALSRA